MYCPLRSMINVVDVLTAGSCLRIAPVHLASSTAAAARVMRQNRRCDIPLEVPVCSDLHRLGARFRRQLPITASDVRVRTDVAFPRQRLAVFLDKCFWHCFDQHGNSLRVSSEYWSAKFDRNASRSERVMWICDHVPAEVTVERVITTLRAKRRTPTNSRSRAGTPRQRVAFDRAVRDE